MFDDDRQTDRPTDDRRDPEDPDGNRDGDRTSNPAGILVVNSNFSHKVADHLLALADTLGVEPKISRQTLSQLGSDPLNAEELGNMMSLQQRTRQRAVTDLSGVPATIPVGAAASTGTLVQKQLDVRDALVRPVDVITWSHKLEGNGSPSAAAAVLTAVTIPFYDPGTIFVGNKGAIGVDYDAVPEQVARLVGTLAHESVDTTDFSQGYWAASYIEVMAGSRTREELQQQVNQTIAGRSLWFSASDLRFFDDDPADLPAPFHDERAYVGTHPDRYGSIGGNEDRVIETQPADVESVHLVVLQRLNQRWVNALKRDAVAWLEDRIETGGNKYADRWRNLCAANGITDPVAEFHRFKREHLEDRIGA